MLRNLLTRLKIVLILIGVALLAFGIYNAVMAHKTPYNLNALGDKEIKPGMLVEGEIYGNFGAYEESYSTNYGVKQKSTVLWYYIIPVGEESYMGIAVNANTMGAKYDRQTDQTYAYYFEESTNIPPETISVKGTISKMDSEDEQYYKTALKELGFTDSEILKYGLPYYISYGNYDHWLVMCLAGAGILALGVILIILTRNKR